ncbi:unnamed protein product [Auanema sp. JU1783]|nr:unnamed protein product [Auanema sp. JU1783]
MCISTAGQIVYGLVMLACLVLTAVALFTPGWTQVKGAPKADVFSKSEGIMPWSCAKRWKNSDCSEWWKDTPSWQHIVIVCMWMALIIEAFCLAWNLIALLSCCLKSCLLHPIAPASIVVTILLLISVLVYGINGKEFVIYSTNPHIGEPGQLGYSFALACVACALAAADSILSFFIICCAQICC